MRVIQALLLTAVVALGQAEAPAQPPTDAATQVQRLVRQLESDERLKRDEAQEQLVQLGPAILDQLQPLIDRAKTADVKHRLEQVQSQLQTQRAQDFAKARGVTLKGQMRLSEIVAAFTQQTGNKLFDHRAAFGQEATDPTLSVDFSNTPFWEALDRVLDQANLTLYSYAGKDGLAFVTRSNGESPRGPRATYAGAFRMEVIKVIAERDFRRPGHDMLQFTLEAAWEPRLAPIMVQQPMDEVQATDDKGHSLKSDSPKTEIEIPIEGTRTAVEFPVSFELPPRGAEKISLLKGKLIAVVPSRVEAFQFDDIADKNNAEQHRAGATVVLEQVRKNQEVWEVRVRVKFEEAFGSLDSHRAWIYDNEAYVIGPDKQRIESGGLEKTRQGKDEVGVAYLFSLPNGPAGCSFVYKTPAAILKIPFEYQIKDVKLP